MSGLNLAQLTAHGFIKSAYNLFGKADPRSVCFVKTGAGTIALKAGTAIAVAGRMKAFPAQTNVLMPALVAGTDYAVYACDDGTLRADASFTAPSGYTAANSRKIGGFHYSPGGNAVPISKAAVAAGTAIGAQTVTADKWALYLLSVNSAGAITVTPAAGNVAGYATEALAIAALPARPALTAAMGYITVLTAAGLAWIAGTDALAGGAGGNPATTTNYYPASSAAIGLTLSRGTIATAIASTEFTYHLGGDSTPQINAYSLWDLKFKPACPDPRGMALVADGFWADIYLLGVDHLTNGSSKYNVTIADGSSPPKVPTSFGGNGITAYTSFNRWQAAEVMAHHGKRLPTYGEFSALAFGTTEAVSIGGDPGSTTWNATYISKWGCAQVTGNLWQWGADFGGGAVAAGYIANTGGRGSTYQQENAAIFGGHWYNTSNSGSRASSWANSPALSSSAISSRGVCDHLVLE